MVMKRWQMPYNLTAKCYFLSQNQHFIISAILRKNEFSAMLNNSDIVLLKTLEATLRKGKVTALHNNTGIELL